MTVLNFTDFDDVREFINALPADEQDLTTEIVAPRVGCTVQTVNRHLKKIVDAEARPQVELPIWLLEVYQLISRHFIVRRILDEDIPQYSLSLRIE
ncbi:hypothetical protein [Halopelagius fulvigenes]|uniref:Uncharacterized protein n=1 Tax=Halopelagius fulvigenes TaxID=1198324 RepID=A0ABD5TXH6_9EURY